MMRTVIFAAMTFGVCVPLTVSAQSTGSHIRKRSDETHQLANLEPNRGLLAVDEITACFADKFTIRSREILALPFGSREQQQKTDDLLGYTNRCVPNGYEVKGQAMVFISSLAENLAEQDLNLKRDGSVKDIDTTVFSKATAPASLSASETFGFCVVVRDPKGVMEAMATEPGGAAEVGKLRAIAPSLAGCVPAGEEASFDPRNLRAALAIGLYRVEQAVRNEKTNA